VGLAVWGWLWWKTRSLRKEAGNVIEGEFRDITQAQRLQDEDLRPRDPRRL
jgi:hypothetical protein